MIRSRLSTLAPLLALLVVPGCGDSGGGSAAGFDLGAPTAGSGSAGLAQAGAQDFGLFRQILEDGQIPGPGTLDDLGFFAEHKLDYPEADCGDDVCVHAAVGVMGNMINGGDCTLIQIGLNTPIDPAELERPPIHVVLAIDTSGSMEGDPLTYVIAGLKRMLQELEPEDTVSLVTYSDEAHVVLEAVPATETTTLQEAFDGLVAGGATDLYAGLFEAYQLAGAHFDHARQNRVMFLSDGLATAGLTDPAKLAGLAAANAKLGISTTTIGVGVEFDIEAMRGVAEVGAGSFYFLDDPAAVEEVFVDEVKTFLVPVATDVRFELAVGEDYVLGDVYGTNGFTASAAGGVIEIPALFLAGRTDASDPIDEGRRGGGGAILIELIPVGAGDSDGPHAVLDVDASWHDPVDGSALGHLVPLTTDDVPTAIPLEGYFTDFTVEKAFVMLNLFVAFEMATLLAADSDLPAARSLLETVGASAEGWVADNPDPDIEDDLVYVGLFVDILAEQEQALGINVPPPAEQPDPWAYD